MLANSLLNYNYEPYVIINSDQPTFYNTKDVQLYNLSNNNVKSNILKFIKFFIFIKKMKINIIFSCYESRLTTLYSRLVKIILNKVIIISGYRESFIANNFIVMDKLTNILCDSMIANNSDICKKINEKISMSRNKMHFIPNIADEKGFFPLNPKKTRIKRGLLFNDQKYKFFIFGIFGSYKTEFRD